MKQDKQKHAIVGAVLGVILSRFGITGLLVGWLIVIGYELFQGWSGTGLMEFADILAGGIPLTIIFFVFYFLKVKGQR